MTELFELHNTQAQTAIDAVQWEGGRVHRQLAGAAEHVAPSNDNSKAESAVQTHHLQNPALLHKQR